MDFEQKKAQYERATAQARHNAHKPTVTRDGHAVTVLANVGNPEDAKTAIENGAEGIGLYRIERVYLEKPAPPGTNYLLNEMRSTLEAAKGLPVCVRLLDVGADKPLPYVDMENEINPSLGLRGIRFLLKHQDLLTTQLKALLRLSADFDVQILVPMVTLPEDMKQVGTLLAELASELKVESIPKLGAMIETPAAVLAAAEIANHSDFLSFGTNDLTQYVFAADRDNASVDAYFNDAHQAVFRLLNMVHEDVPKIPLSLCGELAGRPEQVLKILQCGIRTISVAPPLIPFIKEAIRELTLIQ